MATEWEKHDRNVSCVLGAVGRLRKAPHCQETDITV